MPLFSPIINPSAIIMTISMVLVLVVLAAAVLVLHLHYRNARRERTRQRLFKQWRPLVFAYLDGAPLDQEIRRAARRQPVWLLRLCVHLATLMRGATFERLREMLAEAGLIDWLLKELHSRREARVTTAARALALFQVPEAKPQLNRLVQSDSPAVVFSAALALARVAERQDLPPLLDVLAEFSATHQDLVVMVLLGYAEANPGEFADFLNGHEVRDDDLKVLVLETLGRLRLRESEPFLRAEVENPTSDEAGLKALRALGELRLMSSADLVRRAMNSANWETRAVAAWATGRLKDAQSLPRLQELMGDKMWAVRLNAANAMTSMEAPGLDALQTVAETSEDPFAEDMAHLALDRQAKSVPLL